MRYVFLLILAISLVSFNIGWAADAAADKEAVVKTVVVEENPDQNLKPVDVGPTTGTASEDYGVNRPRVMPAGETYDENTGLPDVVQSDAEDNLE